MQEGEQPVKEDLSISEANLANDKKSHLKFLK